MRMSCDVSGAGVGKLTRSTVLQRLFTSCANAPERWPWDFKGDQCGLYRPEVGLERKESFEFRYFIQKYTYTFAEICPRYKAFAWVTNKNISLGTEVVSLNVLLVISLGMYSGKLIQKNLKNCGIIIAAEYHCDPKCRNLGHSPLVVCPSPNYYIPSSKALEIHGKE